MVPPDSPRTFEDAIDDLKEFARIMPKQYVRELSFSRIASAEGLDRVLVRDDNGLSFYLYGEPARVAFMPEETPIGWRQALDMITQYLSNPRMGFAIERSRSSVPEMDRVVRESYAGNRDTIPS